MKWISTTEQNPWMELEPSCGTDGAELKIRSGFGQKIRGFGGCFNELGKIALDKLPEKEKKAVLQELFTAEGCNFTFCRFPVGANDFSESWYSCNDTEGDYAMEHFSTKRDEKYLVPYIKEAQQINPDLSFFVSPWSPPAWMKFPQAYNYGTLVWEKKNLEAYALYFVKYIQAFEKMGIPIAQLHIQNEPCSTQKFPSCIWTGEEFREFIGEYLAPSFRTHGINTDIWLGTINGPEVDDRYDKTRYNDYANIVLEDEACRESVKGIAYQWAGKYAMQKTHMAFPELELIQSESECGDGKNTWAYARYIFEMMHHYFINGASAYVYWNMILEPGGRSTWGWNQNSMVTVENGKAIYNPELYVMKHFSHFVKPGARLLNLQGRWNANAIGFENPDGEKCLVIMNPFREEKSITVEDKTYTLPSQSFNTIII